MTLCGQIVELHFGRAVETGHAQNRSHGRNIGDIAVLDKETTLVEKMLYTPHVVIQ
jgi:hypothetical protein